MKKKVYYLTGKAMLTFTTEGIEAGSKKEALKLFLDGEKGIADEQGYDYKLSTFYISHTEDAEDEDSDH